MRALLFLCLALAACGPNPAQQGALPDVRAAAVQPWFICDGIDAPYAYVFGPRENGRTHLLQIDKTTAGRLFDSDITLGAEEGAAGSVYTGLLYEGAEIGAIRQLNPGMLETPGAAYTTPFASVRFRDVETSCRWMPRTRLLALTDRRSLIIYEGDDGDLIYTTFDFAAASRQQPIELSENGRSTTFSVEVRDGAENLNPDGVTFDFNAPDAFAYRIIAQRDGQGRVEVRRNGEILQSEPMTAFQLGAAEE